MSGKFNYYLLNCKNLILGNYACNKHINLIAIKEYKPPNKILIFSSLEPHHLTEKLLNEKGIESIEIFFK
jgi:hypothetical protein